MKLLTTHTVQLVSLVVGSCSVAFASLNDVPYFTGPGIYSFVPYGASPVVELNSWGGGTAPGEAVRIWPLSNNANHQFTDNERWQFTLVSGNYQDGTYLLFNVRNGYYLTSTGNTLASLANTPTNPSVLWNVTDVSGSSGGNRVFTITQANGNGQIYVPAGASGYSQGTYVNFGSPGNNANTKFYIITHAPTS